WRPGGACGTYAQPRHSGNRNCYRNWRLLVGMVEEALVTGTAVGVAVPALKRCSKPDADSLDPSSRRRFRGHQELSPTALPAFRTTGRTDNLPEYPVPQNLT